MFEEEKKGDTFTISISSILQEAVGRVIEHGMAHNPHGSELNSTKITLTHKKEVPDNDDELID